MAKNTMVSRKRRKTLPKIKLSQLPRSVRPEVKYSDREIIGTSHTGTILARPDATSNTQGDDGDQMIGSDCFLKALEFSLQLATTNWTMCRVSVLMPRDPSTVVPTLQPYLKYSHREYVVLHDEVFTNTEKTGMRLKKKLNILQKWNITGTSIQQGNVLVKFNLDGTAGYAANLRTYYTDP